MVNFQEIVAIGSDHAGFYMKEILKKKLQEWGCLPHDFGTFSEQSVDYPDIIHPLASAVNKKDFSWGIIICGSGNGAAIVANKYSNIRAAVCWSLEITKLARKHNNANIIALPARFITQNQAVQFVDVFRQTEFEKGRHELRTTKISHILRKQS